MSNYKSNHDEYQHLMEKLISENMQQTMDLLKNSSKDKNNSFIFLDNNISQLIFAYIIKRLEQHANVENHKAETDSDVVDELISVLDTMIEDNRNTFEEVIRIMNEKI